jgi:SSS family transporter
MTNILVTAMLLTGGSAVVNALTGIPTAAACYLLPIGVVLYTMFGGIKATFLTDYVHTVVIVVVLLTFAFTAYATNPHLGSPGKVWDLLQEAAAAHPVDGNKDGSYLTMKSTQGAIFFVINIVGNFGTVFCDNGYYNKAIAASPVHALPGYVAGGLAWFAIPFVAATTMGLSGLALESNPIWPTYPSRLDPSDVSAGLVLPATAVAMMGKGGAAAAILIVFMAVTSAMSAELIAVSTIWTYDIFQTYFRPQASGRTLINMSHAAVVGYAILLASFSTGLYYIGISLGYLYLLMGVIISSAVLPAALTLLWSQQNWAAATLSPVLGFICAMVGWLVQAKKEFGILSVDSTGSNYPMLVGNVVALLAPCIFIPILTYVFKPQNYDWESMKLIKKADDHDLAEAAHIDLEMIPGGHEESRAEEEAEQAQLLRASKIARWLTVFLTLALLVFWPMPMLGSKYVFSKPFFRGWVVVAIMWLFFSGFTGELIRPKTKANVQTNLYVVVVYPLWEGRHTMARTFKAIVNDITGKQKPNIMVTHGIDKAGSGTPPEQVDEKGKAETEKSEIAGM